MSKETKLYLYIIYTDGVESDTIDLAEIRNKRNPWITLIKSEEVQIEISLDTDKLYKENRNTLGISAKYGGQKYALMGDSDSTTVLTTDLIRIVRRLVPEDKVIHMIADVTLSDINFTTVSSVLDGAVTKNVIIDNCKI